MEDHTMRSLLNGIVFIALLPLALWSFLFHGFMSLLIPWVRKRKRAGQAGGPQHYQWFGLSEVIQKPMVLPYIMVAGPRWNCHAVIGLVGPFPVEQELSIEVDTARSSAAQWTIVAYHGEHETTTYLDSGTTKPDQSWADLKVAPGLHRFVLRYYGCSDEVHFPAIKIDGEVKVQAREVSAEAQSYQETLQDLTKKQGMFFLALHYYIYPLLRLRRWLPGGFVRAQYLPIGNPRTAFQFGCIRPGERVSVTCGEGVLENTSVYLAVFNLRSFPVFWETVSSASYISAQQGHYGHYLVRIHAHGGAAHPEQRDVTSRSMMR